ncbi:hypothetical protein LTR95_013257 [Oleoguttula sp. CCFEE 5521]
MSSLLPRPRRTKFALTLNILDLHNVPLVSGQSYIKWHIEHSSSAEHRGRTTKSPIKDHRVTYDYSKELVVRLSVGKDGVLTACWAEFEVLQEYGGGGKRDEITLGRARLNLAEYVGATGSGAGEHDGEEGKGVVRRYLMQDSKINSTLRLGIAMQHVEGTREYTAPPLRSAPVFGGIAGIISAEAQQAGSTADNHVDPSDPAAGPMPSLSVRSKEIGEAQDMYRRALAAFWASQPGELKADECIEDIFSGGDGWGTHGKPEDISPSGTGAVTPRTEDERGEKGKGHKSKEGGGKSWGSKGGKVTGGGFGRKKLDKSSQKVVGELDEFDVREDLRSWRVGSKAMG